MWASLFAIRPRLIPSDRGSSHRSATAVTAGTWSSPPGYALRMTPDRPSEKQQYERWPVRAWIAALLAWPVIGAFVVGVGESGAAGASDPLILLRRWVPWAVWLVAMPIMMELARRVPLLPPRRNSVAVHIVGAIAVSVLNAVLMLTLFVLLPADLFDWTRHTPRVMFVSGLAFNFLGTVLIYGSSVVAIQAYEERRRSRRKELETSRLRKELADTEFHLLESRVYPQLLTRSLATLERMLEANSPAAEDLIESFSRFLRLSLQRMKSGAVRLAADVDLIQALLHLQRICHGGTFTVERVGDAAPGQYLDLQPVIDSFADVTAPWKTLTKIILSSGDNDEPALAIRFEISGGSTDALGEIVQRLQGLQNIDVVEWSGGVLMLTVRPASAAETSSAGSAGA
jgi:hypothetical protein